MNLKKNIQIIGDGSISRQERMYRLLVMVGLIGLATGIVSGVIAGENLYNLIAMVVAFVLLFLIVCLTLYFDKIQLGALLIAAIINFLVMPYNFMSGGGIYGGGPIWFLFGMVFVCLIVEKRIKYVMTLASFFVCALCYCIAYYHPEMVVSHSTRMAYVDSFSTLTIVTVLICLMILFQNEIFRSENEITQKQKKEIEELNQMQNRFFSTMSHEIRTPINTIIGLNEMILREDVSDEVAADAKSIQGASKMLLALINDILDMSKIESGQMEIVPVTYDVGSMLSDIVNMIWIRAKKKELEFHIDVDRTLPSQLYGDEVRIKQILINVLNNAVKYTSEGSVMLSIQCKRQEKGEVFISYSVTDTGMGIKKENIPYLFSAFKRVDEEKNRYIEGSGLGLSIVKQLVELMNGDITVNSVYTKGSTFVITIPQKVMGDAQIGEIDLESNHEINAREHYKQSFEAPEAHILVVDDNETNLMVVEKLLRDTKVNIETVTSGRECLKKTFQNRYDCIFMDHLMPNMDGIQCLREIRKQTGGLNQNTPVVALTANTGGENQVLYRREGFDGYLVKPVTGVQLETELLRHLSRELVNRRRLANFLEDAQSPVMEHKKKLPVMISADSTCDLPLYLLERHHIAVIPYRVITEGGEFMDGVEIETEGVLSYMCDEGGKARSEPPEIEDYEVFFAEQLTKAQYIIHLSLAKNVGEGCQRALEAAKAFDNVIVIDSGHLTCGMGLVVLSAAKYAEISMDVEEVIRKIETIKNRVRSSFIVTDTEYLTRAGRMSAKVDALCRTVLIHPVIVLKNSSMKLGALRVGTREASWKSYVKSALSGTVNIDKSVLYIAHAGLNGEELKMIENQVRSLVDFEHIIIQSASSAIACNCGPGTFGLLFMTKE